MMPAERIADLEAVARQQREDIERLLSMNADLQARVHESEARLANAAKSRICHRCGCT